MCDTTNPEFEPFEDDQDNLPEDDEDTLDGGDWDYDPQEGRMNAAKSELKSWLRGIFEEDSRIKVLRCGGWLSEEDTGGHWNPYLSATVVDDDGKEYTYPGDFPEEGVNPSLDSLWDILEGHGDNIRSEIDNFSLAFPMDDEDDYTRDEVGAS